MLVVADLPVISPWLDAAKQGMPFGTAMGTGDGVQGEVLVQGAEDAVEVIGSWLGCRGDGFGAGQTGFSSAGWCREVGVSRRCDWLAAGHEALVVRNQRPSSDSGAASGVRSGRRWR